MKVIEGIQEAVKNLEGQPLKAPNSANGLLVKAVLVEHLSYSTKQNLTGQDQIRAYDLALKLHNCKEENFEIEQSDLEFTKALIVGAPMYAPIITGFILKKLENVVEKIEDKGTPTA